MWGAIVGAVGRAVGGASARAAAGATTRAAASRGAASSAARTAKRAPTAANKAAARRAGRTAAADQRAADEAGRVHDRNDRVIDMLNQSTGALEKSQNYFSHAITVTVQGGPKASLRRCWFLCVAAVFGRRARAVEAVWGETMNAQWDITGKSVTCTLAYTTGSMNDPWTNFDTQHPGAMLQRGPDQVTIGGGWSRAYMTLNQQTMSFFGLNKGLDRARMVGGQLVFDPTTPLNSLPGELTDPTTLNKLGVAPGAVYTTSVGQLYAVSLDPAAGAEGWRIDKPPVDALQPRPIALVQPFTVVQTNNALSEMPVRITGSSTEALPYQAHKPESAGPGLVYVFRGGDTGIVPRLPDDGRVITTGEKLDRRVQPPRPPVDGTSRGHLLVMVAAALSSPGQLVPAPPNYPDNTESLAAEGLFMWPPNRQWQLFATSDRYRYQPNAVVAQVRQLDNAFRLDQGGHYTPGRVVNVRPAGN